MAKNRQKIKIELLRQRKFNSKENYWKIWFCMPKLAKKSRQQISRYRQNWGKRIGKNWKKISFWAKKSLITKGFTKKLILKPKLGQKWQNNMQRICNSTYCPAEGSPLSLAGCSSTRMLVSGALWILKNKEHHSNLLSCWGIPTFVGRLQLNKNVGIWSLLSIVVTMKRETWTVSISLKIVDFDVVSESIWLTIILTMKRETWAIPR